MKIGDLIKYQWRDDVEPIVGIITDVVPPPMGNGAPQLSIKLLESDGANRAYDIWYIDEIEVV